MRLAALAPLCLALLAPAAGAQRLAGPVDTSGIALEPARFAGPAADTTAPRWRRADGTPTPQALAVLAALRDAAARGLRAADYDADALTARAERPDPAFEPALTRALLRFLVHLHAGRVAPAAVGQRLPATHGAVDFAALAHAVAAAPDPAAAIAAAEPPYAGYAALRDALARYRALAADATLRPPPAPPRALRPGDPAPDAPALRRWLRALGDLEAEGAPPADPARYDVALAEAVRRFQRRHGLSDDAVLGPATVAALRVPLEARAAQLALALERWRWLPDVAPARAVVVNVPAFRLLTFEHDPAAAHPVLRMNVIVGQAHGRHATPLFVGTLREVVFRPYWDVPPRIAATELVPRFRRDPGRGAAQGFELVTAGGRRVAFTRANLAAVGGGVRLRQRPGDGNALGDVKFVFPNPFDVYLHGTPAVELFAEARRDFSHGCIRVERPGELAAWVLGWERDRVDAAMRGAWNGRVAVAEPPTVVVLYVTAAVDAQGSVRFWPDLYGHDAALRRALASTALSDAR